MGEKHGSNEKAAGVWDSRKRKKNSRSFVQLVVLFHDITKKKKKKKEREEELLILKPDTLILASPKGLSIFEEIK